MGGVGVPPLVEHIAGSDRSVMPRSVGCWHPSDRSKCRLCVSRLAASLGRLTRQEHPYRDGCPVVLRRRLPLAAMRSNRPGSHDVANMSGDPRSAVVRSGPGGNLRERDPRFRDALPIACPISYPSESPSRKARSGCSCPLPNSVSHCSTMLANERGRTVRSFLRRYRR